jgi:uncharacterized membrane protein YjjB (DUF3815 family)
MYGSMADPPVRDLESLPLPLALRPLLKRLIALPESDVSTDDILAIVLIVRMGDAMHKNAYATFLIKSFVDELRQKLNVHALDLELEVSATRWTYLQGTLMVYHRIAWDFDGYAMQSLSKIALGVLEDNITVREAFHLIDETEKETQFTSFEKHYRNFPGRIALIPLLASTGCTVYFGGTWVDFGFAILTGTTAGVIHYICCRKPELAGIQDLLVSISTAMISTMAMTLFPNAVCFPAQVLGTLFWFLYGISFMLSLYEMTQGLTMTGLTRFALAILNSFILAFGVVIGVWFAAYGGPNRFDLILQECSNLDYAVDPKWFGLLYPIVAIGALMQMKVSMKYWGIGLIVQLTAAGGQYVLNDVWKQPLFVSNFLPAFMATLMAHIMIQLTNTLKCSELAIPNMAYLFKDYKKRQSIRVELPVRNLSKYKHYNKSKPSARINFQDSGWADTGLSTDGYVRNEKFQYQRSDLWFILIPALYLLVPGSSVWRIAFFSIVSSTNGGGGDEFSTQALLSGIFIIGIGQVIGVRLALSSLVVFQEFKRCFSSKKKDPVEESPPMSRSESFEIVKPETSPFKDEDPET